MCEYFMQVHDMSRFINWQDHPNTSGYHLIGYNNKPLLIGSKQRLNKRGPITDNQLCTAAKVWFMSGDKILPLRLGPVRPSTLSHLYVTMLSVEFFVSSVVSVQDWTSCNRNSFCAWISMKGWMGLTTVNIWEVTNLRLLHHKCNQK